MNHGRGSKLETNTQEGIKMISIKRFKSSHHRIERSSADESESGFLKFHSNCRWPSGFVLKGGEYATGEFFVFASSGQVDILDMVDVDMYYGTGSSIELAEVDAFQHYLKNQQI